MKQPKIIAITARDPKTELYIQKVIQQGKKKGLFKGCEFMFTYEGECTIDLLEAKIIEKARKLAKEIIKDLKS